MEDIKTRLGLDHIVDNTQCIRRCKRTINNFQEDDGALIITIDSKSDFIFGSLHRQYYEILDI